MSSIQYKLGKNSHVIPKHGDATLEFLVRITQEDVNHGNGSSATSFLSTYRCFEVSMGSSRQFQIVESRIHSV